MQCAGMNLAVLCNSTSSAYLKRQNKLLWWQGTESKGLDHRGQTRWAIPDNSSKHIVGASALLV